MYWAVATLCFFGFFRLGELLLSDASLPHLSWGDMTYDHASEPSMMKVHLRSSKCDQYGKGADVFVGKTGNTLCPVAACLAYLTVRGKTEPGAFLLKSDRQPLLKPVFVSELRKALGALGLHQAAYAGHSFRICAATAAAAAGVEDSTIQLMGRWNSAAFLGYIKLPALSLRRLPRELHSCRVRWVSVSRLCIDYCQPCYSCTHATVTISHYSLGAVCVSACLNPWAGDPPTIRQGRGGSSHTPLTPPARSRGRGRNPDARQKLHRVEFDPSRVPRRELNEG